MRGWRCACRPPDSSLVQAPWCSSARGAGSLALKPDLPPQGPPTPLALCCNPHWLALPTPAQPLPGPGLPPSCWTPSTPLPRALCASGPLAAPRASGPDGHLPKVLPASCWALAQSSAKDVPTAGKERPRFGSHTRQLNPQLDIYFGRAVIKMHLGSTYLCLIRPCWVSMEIPSVVTGRAPWAPSLAGGDRAEARSQGPAGCSVPAVDRSPGESPGARTASLHGSARGRPGLRRRAGLGAQTDGRTEGRGQAFGVSGLRRSGPSRSPAVVAVEGRRGRPRWWRGG